MATIEPRDWAWLEDSYWYCPASDMPAIRTQPGNTFEAVIDQTVWRLSGCRDGYFWGVASTLLTPVGETPDPSGKSDSTFFASITPDGRVHITFVRSAVSTTVGTGVVRVDGSRAWFSMQMSSGPGDALVVHWAQMLPVAPRDRAWLDLPGAGISVPQMVGDIPLPQPTGQGQD